MSHRDIYEAGFDEDDGQPIHRRSCPECEGQIHTDGGETVCEGCGLIIEEYRIDHGPEWRSFDDQAESRSRTGAPLTPTRHDRGLSTEIGRFRDGNGRQLSGETRLHLSRLRTRHTRAKFDSTAARNLSHALTEIARLGSALDLPEAIRDRASAIYRDATEQDLIMGRSLEQLAAAAVYAACRCGSVSCTIESLASVSSCSVGQIRRGYAVLNRELTLPAVVPRTTDALSRLCAAFGLEAAVRTQAGELVESAERTGVTNGRSPSGVAAAALYLAMQEGDRQVSQSQIATEAGTTATTLRTRMRELQEAG